MNLNVNPWKASYSYPEFAPTKDLSLMSPSTSIESRTVAVLGAKGFLGSNVAMYLARQGHRVRACCRDKKNLGEISEVELEICPGNNHDPDFLKGVLDGCDAVFDFSSSTNPRTNFSTPGIEYNTTVLTLTDVVEAAIRAKVKKIIFPSSGGTVYGQCDEPKSESAPYSPQTPYALCKINCEQKLMECVASKRIAADVFRIGNVFGPGQLAAKGAGVIAHWATSLVKGEKPVVIGDEHYVRDYIYVKDLCAFLEHSLIDLNSSDVWNLASGKSTSILELFEIFQRAAGKNLEAEFRESRITDNTSVLLDCSKLQNSCPDVELTDLETAIRETIQWHQMPGKLAAK